MVKIPKKTGNKKGYGLKNGLFDRILLKLQKSENGNIFLK
jgi:hypothetical protein